MLPNVNLPNSDSFLNRMSLIKWCLVRVGCKEGHKNGTMCLIESGLCARFNSGEGGGDLEGSLWAHVVELK